MNQELLIIGFGNQAKAWALNLRDSGFKITIAVRKKSAQLELIKKLKFESILLDDSALKNFKRAVLLIPDHTHKEFFQKYSQPFSAGTAFIYAHGFSCSYNDIPKEFSQFNHLLLAPKAIASELRLQYEVKGKLAAVISSEFSQNRREDLIYLKELAKNLGITVGPYPCTFSEETRADLFSEQSLLCSLIPYGALHSYKLLREKNIPAEVAYFECFVEMKLIVDTLMKVGPAQFFEMISPNAFIGSVKAEKLFFDQEFLKKYETLWSDIQSEKFIQEVKNISESELQKLKTTVVSRWQNEELTQTYTKIR